VGVDAEKERSVDTLLLSILADSLRDGEHMPFIEAALERRAAMPRGAECDPLRGQRRVRRFGVVRGDKPGDIDEHVV